MITMRRGWLCVAACLTPLSALAAAELSIDGAAKVYAGDGATVTLVPVTPRSARRVLLRVDGTGSSLDGTIVAHELHEAPGKIDYVRTLEGQRFVTLTARDRSAKRDLEAPAHALKRADESALSAALGAANLACGSSLQAAMEWSAIEPMLRRIDAGGACGAALRAISQVCEDAVGRDAALRGLRSVRCTAGSTSHASLSDARLTWTVAPDSPGSDEQVRAYLMKSL